jgi:hypothetical protein
LISKNKKIFFNYFFYVSLIVFLNIPFPCIASEENIFSESCLWSPSLNFMYNGNIVKSIDSDFDSNKNDEWHNEKANLIREAFKIVDGPNVAISQLNIVYKNSNKYLLQTFDIPYFFLSGWDKNNLSLGCNAENKISSLSLIDNRYKDVVFIKSSHPKIKNRVSYAKHLISIYNVDHHISNKIESRLDRIRKKPTELIGYLPYLKQEGSSNESKTFSSRFYDSEQALFLSVISNFTKEKIHFSDLISNIPEKSKIYQCGLNISSYYDMCFDCGDTGFRQIEATCGFFDTLSKALFECSAEFDINMMKPFIMVSSQKTHLVEEFSWRSRYIGTTVNNYKEKYKTQFELLRKNGFINDKNMLEATKFPPYIAQMLVNSK